MVEQAPYKVIKKIDGIELRKYPELLLATVTGNHDESSFRMLFNYISGNNSAQGKISMTAPVVSSESIKMTAPVISDDRFFTFVMPSNYTPETLPMPRDPRIKIHVQATRIFAILGFSGRTKSELVRQKGEELTRVLAANKLRTRGDVFLMRYNSPFAPGFMRRNEVGIEVVEWGMGHSSKS